MTERRAGKGIDEAVARVVQELTPARVVDDGRDSEVKYDTLLTHRRGVRLLVDHEEDLDLITRSDVDRLVVLGEHYVPRARAIKLLQQLQKGPREDLVQMGINHPGLRGVRDLEAGWELQLNPETGHTFDPDLIEQSGPEAAAFVHRTYKVVVDFTDPDQAASFEAAARRRLSRQGISQGSLRRDDSVRVDEQQLIDAQIRGEVVLIPGAHEVNLAKSWDVVPRVIRSASDRQLVEETLFKSPEPLNDLS